MQKDDHPDSKAENYYAPWEKNFIKIITPFEEFIHRQTTSSILLIMVAIVTLFIANSNYAEHYEHLKHLVIGFDFGGWALSKSLHHWINDGLMTLFFFLVGLELKREIIVGELSDLRKAALPLFAAIGGMIMPALIYVVFNLEGDTAQGWGIPMATDIAFALGILALLSNRIPKALVTFLVALAIVDDLGAVVVIALFYTQSIAMDALMVAAGLFLVLVLFNMSGIRRTSPYLLVTLLLWYALMQSGVHATLAGVLSAFTIPARPKYNPMNFSQSVRSLMQRFDKSHGEDNSIMTNDELRSIAQALESGAHKVQALLQRLEHHLHMPVAYLVIPLFVFINAGIPIELSTLSETLVHPVSLGISFGLILGKFIGILATSWVCLKVGIAILPKNVTFNQIAGVSLLAAIGFTMSIFIAELAFAQQAELLLVSKTSIIVTSAVAGIAGTVWLILATKKKEA